MYSMYLITTHFIRDLSNVHEVARKNELKAEAKLLPRRKFAYKQFMSFRSHLTRMRRAHYACCKCDELRQG